MTISRRDLLLGATGLAAAGSVASPGQVFAQAAAGAPKYTPEPGATLRLLRWAPFVKGDDESWLANTKKFSDATGVQVRVDKESWEDIRPKAAVAANVGSGPDLMLVWFDDPFQYPEKLLDVTDIATDLGNRFGGWYDGPKGYGQTKDGKFVALPLATIGNGLVWRQSIIEKAGFKEMPQDTKGFLALCQALAKNNLPRAGFAMGNAVGDGNNFAHWIVWSHGGQMVDESGKVVINSPETIAGLRYARELYQSFIPGTEGWLDINNNRAWLAGEVGVTANGVSIYYSTKNEARFKEIADDTRSSILPVGPVGRPVELHQTTSAIIFRHTKFPNAARAYLQFMFDKPQMDAWIGGSSAYCCPALKGFINNPVWDADPVHKPYARASETLRPNGHAGPLGFASAATMADYVMVNMVAEAATGQRTPEEAAKRAETRANRVYRV
jgi:multiple sugar transport system substrate-binding protein